MSGLLCCCVTALTAGVPDGVRDAEEVCGPLGRADMGASDPVAPGV
jgi:hypothetical protein